MKLNKFQIVLILVFVLTGIYVLIITNVKKEYTPNYDLKDFYGMPRKMDVNEYTIVNVKEEDMVKTYFNTYIESVFENTKESYKLLDNEYKNKKYKTYDEYLNYIKSITNDFNDMPKVKKYNIINKKDYKLYVIKDNKNNTYIFKAEAVMKYTIYLDNDTIKLYD